MTVTQDQVVASAREEISALDVRLLATINARISQVAELHRYKAEHGISSFDPDREASLVAFLKRVNGGPLSDEGVDELMTFILDLVKRELARG